MNNNYEGAKKFAKKLIDSDLIKEDALWAFFDYDKLFMKCPYLEVVDEIPEDYIWPIFKNAYEDYLWRRYVNIADVKRQNKNTVKCCFTKQQIKSFEVCGDFIDFMEEAFKRFQNYKGKNPSICKMLANILYLTLEFEWAGHFKISSTRNKPLSFKEKWNILLEFQHKWNSITNISFFFHEDQNINWMPNTIEIAPLETMSFCIETAAKKFEEMNIKEYGEGVEIDLLKIMVERFVEIDQFPIKYQDYYKIYKSLEKYIKENSITNINSDWMTLSIYKFAKGEKDKSQLCQEELTMYNHILKEAGIECNG